jgi:hypothetical protein
MEPATKQPSLMDLSVAIAPWIHIKQVRLAKSRIESGASDIATLTKLEHTFDATTEFDREAKRLSVRAFLTVAAGDLLRISAEFILEYSVDESPVGITDEAASAFGKMNGIHNVWPYWREYVQSSSARVGLFPLTVPLATGASILAHYAAKPASSVAPIPASSVL